MLDSKDIGLLVEIGFIASGRGDVEHAKAIFDALLLLRPERAFAHVGYAVALMNAGRFADASTFLKAARLPEGRESDMVEALLGLALQLEGRAGESEQVLRAVVTRSEGVQMVNDGVRLAQALLGQSSRQAPGPLTGHAIVT